MESREGATSKCKSSWLCARAACAIQRGKITAHEVKRCLKWQLITFDGDKDKWLFGIAGPGRTAGRREAARRKMSSWLSDQEVRIVVFVTSGRKMRRLGF